MEIVTKSPEETKEAGKKIATDIIKIKETKNLEKGTVVALIGGLGAGKTTFVQGFADRFGIKSRLVSPTFIITRSYKVTESSVPFENFYHIDLYRLESNIDQEFAELGIKDAWEDPKNIFLIEWADKINDLLPDNTIKVNFQINNHKRIIKVEGYKK